MEIIVLSDCHLGAKYNNKLKLLHFLESLKDVEVLVLNGDFIDGWKILKSGIKNLNKTDLKIIKVLIKLSKKTKIYWIMGNHDNFLKEFLDENIDNIYIKRELIIKDSLIIHGDQFDIFTLFGGGFFAKIGSIGYEFLLFVNSKFQNRFKISLSKFIKHKVKMASNYINSFEINAVRLAQKTNCSTVICGHIHTPNFKTIDGILYINSGDWQENTNYIEFSNNKWKLKNF